MSATCAANFLTAWSHGSVRCCRFDVYACAFAYRFAVFVPDGNPIVFFLTSPAMVVLGKVVVRGIYTPMQKKGDKGIYTYISASLHFYASEK